MTEYVPAIIAVTFTVFAVVSRRLSRSARSLGRWHSPCFGLIVGPEVLDLVDFGGLLGEPEFVSARPHGRARGGVVHRRERDQRVELA